MCPQPTQTVTLTLLADGAGIRDKLFRLSCRDLGLESLSHQETSLRALTAKALIGVLGIMYLNCYFYF